MLTQPELGALATLDAPTSVSELADSMDRSTSHVSRTISSLAEKDLVTVERDGASKVVRPSMVEPVRVYRSLVGRFPHVDFPELLTKTTIHLLYFLDEPITVAQLAERTDNYRNTVNRIVKRLKNRGILRKDDSRYVLTDDFADLCTFARSLASHLHLVEAPAGDGVILWETVDEYLLGTETAIDDPDYLLTGPRLFAEYDLDLLTTDRRHYFYSERRDEVTVPDLVCHTLLVDDGARYRGYCLLLLASEGYDRDSLLDRAEHYGLSAVVEDLVEYLETRGESDAADVVDWPEFERMADQYGVEL